MAAGKAEGHAAMTACLAALRRAADVIGLFSLGLVIVLTAISVGGRYLFRVPIPDVYDLTRLLHGVAISFGLVLATRGRGHIQVDLLYGALPAGMRRAFSLAADVIVAAVIGLLAWQLWGNVYDLMATGETTVMLQLPLWPFAVFIGLGISLTFLEALLNCLCDLRERAAPPGMAE